MKLLFFVFDSLNERLLSDFYFGTGTPLVRGGPSPKIYSTIGTKKNDVNFLEFGENCCYGNSLFYFSICQFKNAKKYI